MKKILGSIIVILLIAGAFTSVFCSQTFAEEKEAPTLKVGYMDYNGFIDPQADGSYTGYGAEYLSKISEYTGYNYEYVYGEWKDLLEKLKNGEIDLVCSAQYTEERAREYDYSAYPIGYTQGLLYGAKDSKVSYEDFESFDGLDVGVLSGSAMKDIFYNYQKQNDFSCNMVDYVSENEMLKALNSGKIDAMCTEHLANHQELKLLSRFGADAYYLMSYKGSPYIDDINFALQEVKTDVDFEADLFHKYYDSSTAATALVFSSSEKEYIAKSKTIRVGMNGDRAPFCSYDEKTGEFTGICVDVMDEIAKNSGLKFKYVMQEPGVTTVDQLAGGKYDIICGIERDNFATNATIASTEAFMESSIVPVGKSGEVLDLNDKLTAAVPVAFQALIKNLEKNYSNLKIVGYDTNRECLDAVMDGDADIFIQNTHLLSILLQEPKYENINILPVEVMTEHTAIAVPR